MRIAYISYEYPPDSANGGIATYVGQISRVMADRGHEVEVFASSPLRDEVINNNGVLEHWIRETNREDFGIVAGHRFAERHVEQPFDVLEGPEYYADARKAIELVPSMPLVVKMHTPIMMIGSMNFPNMLRFNLKPFARSFLGMIRDLLQRKPPRAIHFANGAEDHHVMDRRECKHAKQAQIMAPPCHSLAEYAEKIWGIPPSQLRVVPYPYIPKQDFLNLKPDNKEMVVGFVGRLERRKGIETLADAIPKVLKVLPNARFRLIGASDHRSSSSELYALWLERKLYRFKDSVEITGKLPLSEMAKAYDGLSICVYPSIWENFPNVCLEAMSAARAVIGSAAGGMAEMLDYGACGRIVQPNDSSALATEIINLLQSPEERTRLGLLARQRVLSEYNQTRIGEMVECLYRDTIALKREEKVVF